MTDQKLTDHLADARACLSRVDQAATNFSAATWLTATCEQIIDHLEAQQTEASLRRGLADITAGRTVDLGSFAQPVAIAAAEPHIRAKIADEIEQHYLGADFGRNPTTGADSPDASLHDAYDEALNLAARIARQEQP